jgi:hypothetical protein
VQFDELSARTVRAVLRGVEVWVAAIAVLAWVIGRHGPITPRVLVVAGLMLGASAAAYLTSVVLIGVLLSAIR